MTILAANNSLLSFLGEYMTSLSCDEVYELLISVWVFLLIDNDRNRTVGQPKRYPVSRSVAKTTDTVEVDDIVIPLVTQMNPRTRQRVRGYLLNVVQNLLITLWITELVDNNGDSTIGQPEGDLAIGSTGKCSETVKIDDIFIALVINFDPVRHTTSSRQWRILALQTVNSEQ